MSDLIDRQAAIDAMSVVNDSICEQQAIDALWELPSVQPTVDVVDVQEVKHGTWTEKEVIYIKDTKDAIDAWQSCRCSICGRYHTQPYMYFFVTPNFCSFCGADMRKDTEN